MKKLSFMFLGAAGLLLASCSNEEKVNAPVENDGNFTVNVKLPSNLSSRAGTVFGLGYQARHLSYAVYDGSSSTLLAEGEANFDENDLTCTVNFNLAKGKSYDIAFFAQSYASLNSANTGDPSNGVYDFDAANHVINVNYNNMNSTDNLADAYDCFYGLLTTNIIGTENVETSVELYRPVAQINWGTNDLDNNYASHDEAFGVNGKNIVTYLDITNAYNKFDVLLGEVTGTQGAVTISGLASPYESTFPYEGNTADGEATAPTLETYVYVAMQYVLAPGWNTVAENASTIYDLNLSVTNEGLANNDGTQTDLVVVNVPVQANYQTNIFGALLTDNVEVTVNKIPTWFTPANNQPY